MKTILLATLTMTLGLLTPSLLATPQQVLMYAAHASMLQHPSLAPRPFIHHAALSKETLLGRIQEFNSYKKLA